MKKTGPEKFITEKYLVCLDQELSDLFKKVSEQATISIFKSKADIYRTALKIGLEKILEK